VPELAARLIVLGAQAGKSDDELCETLGIKQQTLNDYRWRLRREGVEIPHVRWKRPKDETVRLVAELTLAGVPDAEIAQRLGIQKITLAGYRSDARKLGIDVPFRQRKGRPRRTPKQKLEMGELEPRWKKHLEDLERRLANPPPMYVMLECYYRMADNGRSYPIDED
jgi:transposase